MYRELKSQKLVEKVTPTGLQKNRVAKNMEVQKKRGAKKWNPYIAELNECINNTYAFAYVFVMFAASSAPTMESTRGVPPCGGGRRPPPLWVLRRLQTLQKHKQMHMNY